VRERRLPSWNRSVLRETAELVIAGVLFDGVFITAAIVVSVRAFSLDGAGLLTDPGHAFARQPYLAASTIALGIILATLTSWLIASCKFTWKSGARNSRHFNRSTWVGLFELEANNNKINNKIHPKGDDLPQDPSTLVLVELDDGSLVTGVVASFTDEPGVEGKRELVLLWPSMESNSDESVNRVIEFDRIAINEQHIRWLATYRQSIKGTQDYWRLREKIRQSRGGLTAAREASGPRVE
jgi:hypothetical protein